jgi:hypothetical protein
MSEHEVLSTTFLLIADLKADKATTSIANIFITLIPDIHLIPKDISIEPDGNILIDMYESNVDILSISIGNADEGDNIFYAGLFDNRTISVSGRFRFETMVEPRLLRLVEIFKSKLIFNYR